jgi:hypothetical protein
VQLARGGLAVMVLAALLMAPTNKADMSSCSDRCPAWPPSEERPFDGPPPKQRHAIRQVPDAAVNLRAREARWWGLNAPALTAAEANRAVRAARVAAPRSSLLEAIHLAYRFCSTASRSLWYSSYMRACGPICPTMWLSTLSYLFMMTGIATVCTLPKAWPWSA